MLLLQINSIPLCTQQLTQTNTTECSKTSNLKLKTYYFWPFLQEPLAFISLEDEKMLHILCSWSFRLRLKKWTLICTNFPTFLSGLKWQKGSYAQHLSLFTCLSHVHFIPSVFCSNQIQLKNNFLFSWQSHTWRGQETRKREWRCVLVSDLLLLNYLTLGLSEASGQITTAWSWTLPLNLQFTSSFNLFAQLSVFRKWC